MKRFNNKSRGEQLFILGMLFVLFLGIMCFSGCGGKSCETFKCAKEDKENISGMGISIPGCGGCITPGKGCLKGCACWPSSCKCVKLSTEEKDFEGKTVNSSEVTGCDIRYFGGSCFGCGHTEKSCYGACVKLEGNTKYDAFTFGSYDGREVEEHVIGCSDGCKGCAKGMGIGISLMYESEEFLGVD